jgi:threonine dehydrogenase-like Zn-dependent dehydrogenase
MCVKLPDDISYDHGALLGCALGPAYGALKTLGVSAFDTVVVSGLGPVGIGVSALATYLNARVIGLDPEPVRRKAAESIGVAATFNPMDRDIRAQLAEALGERGLMYGVECSGRTEAERLLIDNAAPNARLGFIGQNRGQVPFCPTVDLISKSLSLHGIWHMNMTDVDDLITFLRRRPDLADMMITHRFGLADAQKAFDIFDARQSIKVALVPCGMD